MTFPLFSGMFVDVVMGATQQKGMKMEEFDVFFASDDIYLSFILNTLFTEQEESVDEGC